MNIPLGMSLPHRSPDPIDIGAVPQVARRAEALGFRDLWVTSNTLDHVFSFDAMLILTHAASVTTRIRVGVSVLVLPVQHPGHVAHQVATLDRISDGRAILGVGLGREHHYAEFQVPTGRRVRRFREGVELIKKLWTESKVDYAGDVFHVRGGIVLKPVQAPHPPIWMGGDHPEAVKRAAHLADGWMGSGGSSVATFARSVPILRAELEKAGRDPATFPISKRVFMSVDERPDVARAELHRWFSVVYRNPDGTDASGVHGTPEQVRARLEELMAAGANHLLLNPVGRHVEQVEAAAAAAGLTVRRP
jgi:alkanesulfonate monooxygenase SsuD/methylene tetrahydromethanopterin reductase-like flavin-dependent oxidoreductase (luciferase family)